MLVKPLPVERAFQIADGGRVATVSDIKRILSSEGYFVNEIAGPALTRQLSERIRKAKADGKTA
jgi:hypothetical protein